MEKKIVSYSENPSLPLQVVVTVSGKKEYRLNCKSIKGNYYIMNEDCFYMPDKKWYRKESGLIVQDHATGKWYLIPKKFIESAAYKELKKLPNQFIVESENKELVKLNRGIVGFDDKDNYVLGYFSENPYDNVKLRCLDGSNYLAMNTEIFIGRNILERVSTGEYLQVTSIKDYEKQLSKIENALNHTNNGYNIEDNESMYRFRKKLYEDRKVVIGKNIRKAAKLLGDVTFGIELETSAGYFPEHLQNRTGVVVCRDGSLNGGAEYTTVPMTGAKGINNIIELCGYLGPRHHINQLCSYHVHVGNIQTSRAYIVALYRLCFMIQDTLFKMFPPFKSDYTLANKPHDYNQKLKSFNITGFKGTTKEEFDSYISNNYRSIFTFLTEGILPSKKYNRKNKRHPQNHKWNRHSRYYWVNFMNAFFSNRNTIEFRLHHATLNSVKIINWLYICVAIMRYAEKHTFDILNAPENNSITLFDVLGYYESLNSEEGKQLSTYLKQYVLSRIKSFNEHKSDVLGNWDLITDADYTFKDSNNYSFIF